MIEKLQIIKDQWDELAIVMTENAKQVWQTELGDDSYKNLSIKNCLTNQKEGQLNAKTKTRQLSK